ncbi:MAG: dephospho-CoA kinase [Clostridia bacterium]|nr:dephospho-CoA kinase [Clostridia bacterium]
MIIGLTGGIGCGKSTALEVLKKHGYPVISCDDITRGLYKKRKILKKLRIEFPSAIAGRVFYKADKKEISRIIFSDEKKYTFLTDFLTKETFKVAISRAKKIKGTVIVEVPLLFENNLAANFDKIIVITRDKTARIAAVKNRSKLSEEEITSRMNAQFDYDNNDLSAFTVIKNDGRIEDLAVALLKAIKE